jgi:hypothetical protein
MSRLEFESTIPGFERVKNFNYFRLHGHCDRHLSTLPTFKNQLYIFNVLGAVKTFPEFFDFDGFVFIPPGQNVTGQFYVRVLQRLRNAFRRKRLGQCFLHHDKAPTTHRLLCSNSSPRKTFLSSPDHRAVRISLCLTFGCSLL